MNPCWASTWMPTLTASSGPASTSWSRRPTLQHGVATDGGLRCLREGKPIQNLHAIGSVLSGHDAVKMGDGTGVSLLTALAVAHNILGQMTTKPINRCTAMSCPPQASKRLI